MNGSMVSIRGVVIPAAWDGEGNIVAAAVSARDETEYRIANNGKGNALLALIHKEVEVRGEVREDEKGKTIRVNKFSLKGTDNTWLMNTAKPKRRQAPK